MTDGLVTHTSLARTLLSFGLAHQAAGIGDPIEYQNDVLAPWIFWFEICPTRYTRS